MTIVRVLFFAGARDAAGTPFAALEVPSAGVFPAAFLELLVDAFPGLVDYARCIRLAINGTYASAQDRVFPGDEIAVIPPVSGG